MATPQVEAAETSDAQFVAETFRNELLAQTSRRGQQSIERIWIVCQELIAAGKKITVAEVGRETEKRWESPKAQSIRDQPKRLKRLVELCAATQNPSHNDGRGRQSRREFKIEARAAEVPDPTARAQYRADLEELARLRQENIMLRKALQRVAPISELTAEQCYGEIEPAHVPEPRAGIVLPAPPGSTFTEAERLAVRRFLDDDFLYDEGFRIDPVQGIVRAEEGGRIVLPIAFVNALRKIVD